MIGLSLIVDLSFDLNCKRKPWSWINTKPDCQRGRSVLACMYRIKRAVDLQSVHYFHSIFDTSIERWRIVQQVLGPDRRVRGRRLRGKHGEMNLQEVMTMLAQVMERQWKETTMIHPSKSSRIKYKCRKLRMGAGTNLQEEFAVSSISLFNLDNEAIYLCSKNDSCKTAITY